MYGGLQNQRAVVEIPLNGMLHPGMAPGTLNTSLREPMPPSPALDPHTHAAAFADPLPLGYVECPACADAIGCPVCGGLGIVLDAVATAYDALPSVDYSTAYTVVVARHTVVVVPAAELVKLADAEGEWIIVAREQRHLGLLYARVIPGHRVAVGAHAVGPLRLVGSPELAFGGAR